MFTSTIEIVVHRPIDEVFAYVADARNRPQWDDSVISEELTSPEPIGMGTTVRTRLRSTGRPYTYTWEVTEHRPPHRMTITSTSGPVPTALAFLLSDEEGSTRLGFTLTGRPAGPLRMLQPLLARSTRRDLDRSFGRLKELLESGTAIPDDGR